MLFFRFFLSFHRFSISLLRVMSYMTLSSREKTLFQKIILDDTFSYSVRAFARIRQTLLLKILGGRMHGPSPTSNFFGGRSPSPPRSPPMHLHLNFHQSQFHLRYAFSSIPLPFGVGLLASSFASFSLLPFKLVSCLSSPCCQ